MNERALTISVKQSKNYNERKMKSVVDQYDKIPIFWIKRFKKLKWKIILTDEMPFEKLGWKSAAAITVEAEKKIWINVKMPYKLFRKAIYKAFARFALTSTVNLTNIKTFLEIKEKYSYEITEFYRSLNWKIKNDEDLFTEMFSFVIQTNGKNLSNEKINVFYDYMKSWVYGTIFIKNVTFKQKCIKLEKDCLFTKDQKKLVETTFQRVPHKLRKTFINDSWKLRIVNQIDSYYKNVSGKCNIKTKEIFIKVTATNVAETILHEFGHLLDNIYPGFLISCSPEFSDIYLEERTFLKKIPQMTTQHYYYATSNSIEYFASIFAIYLLNEEEVKKQLPKSYDFFQKVTIHLE